MMRKILMIVFIALALGTLFIQGDRYRVEKKEEILKTLRFQDPSQVKNLQVDNIFGSIVVKGYKGKEVQLSAHKTIKARIEGKIQKAEEEVSLDITEEGNVIDIYIDGPFRRNHHERGNGNDPGYEVHYDFDIQVPRKTNIYLKTATAGNIQITDIEGDFEIQHADGKIIMQDIVGAGTARTANGDVKVHFAKNPDSHCSFKTVAGDIHVVFRENLSADLLLKTRYGDAYSDFPVSLLPVAHSVTEERKNGKYIYRSHASIGVRIGSGGPEITMDTLAGDILIDKK